MVVQFRHSTSAVPGLSAVTFMAPLILGGCTVAVMLAYFTIGSSTMRELRAIYDPHEREQETIEPWLIEEVTARVVNGTTISPLPAYLSSRHLGRSSVPGRARPAPGTRPTWQRSPAWGSTELSRNDADRRRTWPTTRPRPTEPVVVVTVTPPPVEVSAVLPRRPVSAPPAPPAGAAAEQVITLTATVVDEAAPAARPSNSKRWRNRRRLAS
jgi:hypothetical protein